MLNAHKLSVGTGIKSSMVIDSNVIIDTFEPSSPHYKDSYKLMDYVISKKMFFAMPMHGWFEINCTLNRKKKDMKEIVPPIFAGSHQMLIEFIHIDDIFLKNYMSVEIPVIKGMDHIFLVVAKKNNIPLITRDDQMIRVGKECGVNIFTPKEWMENVSSSK